LIQVLAVVFGNLFLFHSGYFRVLKNKLNRTAMIFTKELGKWNKTAVNQGGNGKTKAAENVRYRVQRAAMMV